MVETSQSSFDNLKRLCFFADSDHLTWLDGEGGDVHDASVHRDVLVAHELAGSGARGGDAEAIDHVVEARLEQLEEHLARLAVLGRGLRRGCGTGAQGRRRCISPSASLRA